METNVKKLLSDAARRASDMAEGAKDAFADASRAVGERADVAKLNLELMKLRSDSESVFAEIGHTFYLMNAGRWDASRGESAEQHIEKLLGQAAEKEMLESELVSRISALSGLVECPACHRSCAEENAFCPACGAPLHPVHSGD